MLVERLTKDAQSQFVLVNIVEELVREKVDELIKDLDMCQCENCKLNTCAIALNNLPPHYVTTERGALLAELNTTKIDYQINVVDFAKGYYLFNHIDDCRSTIALEVEKFFSIYDGPVYEKSLRGTPECTCFGKDSMNFAECCDRHCRDATARRIIQIIRERHAQALRGK